MKIETKFNIEDTIWYKHNRKAKRQTVKKIIITDKGILYYEYGVNEYEKFEFEEEKCFATKEECNLAIIEEIAGETRKE